MPRAQTRTLGYRLEVGERFAIALTATERVRALGVRLLDVDTSFELRCEVVALRDGVAEIAGRFERPRLRGRALGRLPDLVSLAGAELRVRKRLDGAVLAVDDPAGVGRLMGGLTAANALRWFAARFPSEPVSVGDGWTETDRWELRSDLTPVRARVPLRPLVDVRCDHRLVALDEHRAEVVTAVAFGGPAARWGPFTVAAAGDGTGRVEVDLDRGKLTSSVKSARLALTVRPGGGRVVVERTSQAGLVTDGR